MNRPMTNPGVNATRSAAHVIAITGRDGNERALPLSLAVTCQRPGTDRDQPGSVGATRTAPPRRARRVVEHPDPAVYITRRLARAAGWGDTPRQARRSTDGEVARCRD
jgi:mRNA-degrading endonuclease toxin of MazEF toxin-antitoxin module